MKTPNLELTEYIAKQIILKGHHNRTDLACIVFPQIWGSTALGFDVDGSTPTVGGMAMTEEYTVIVHDRVSDAYVVFFGSEPAYRVDNPTPEFFKDIIENKMASISEARKRY